MREIVRSILESIDEEIVQYTGDNLLESGIIDSFTIVEILEELEQQLHIRLSPDLVIEENFKTVDRICQLVERQMQDSGVET